MATRRDFVRQMGIGLAASAAAAERLAAQAAQGGGSERLLVANPLHPTPAPIGVDRLPRSPEAGAVARVPAPGDHAVIEEGMTFSVEPGLYDEKHGIGINPSDRLLVLTDRSVLMSRIPFSREWSYLNA